MDGSAEERGPDLPSDPGGAILVDAKHYFSAAFARAHIHSFWPKTIHMGNNNRENSKQIWLPWCDFIPCPSSNCFFVCIIRDLFHCMYVPFGPALQAKPREFSLKKKFNHVSDLKGRTR